MKYLPLLWAGLWRKPIRTVLTVLSIAVAFLLFGVLNGVIAGFHGAQSKLSETRLRVMNRANILEAMPIAYGARIAQVPGVASRIAPDDHGGLLPGSEERLQRRRARIDPFVDVFPADEGAGRAARGDATHAHRRARRRRTRQNDSTGTSVTGSRCIR